MTMQFRTTDLTPRVGTLIEIDRATLLSGKASDEIRKIATLRGVVAFRDMEVTDDEQLRLARSFGKIEGGKSGELYRVSYDPKENPVGAAINLASCYWHIDRTDVVLPPFATILSAKVLSPAGTGDTEFANTYAAYEDLPADDKRLIDRLRVEHRMETAFREAMPDATAEQMALWPSHMTPKIHPLVWRHRDGRKSLILSNSATRVIGMDEAEGRALLARLLAWATKPEYTYRHVWRLGDLVMWNNTGTMHRAHFYDPNCGRRMHRTAIVGCEPFDTEAEVEVSQSV